MRIVETRSGVAEAKSTIDGMRTTRDTQMASMTALKTQLRDQNQRLLLVSQEKARLEAKNRINSVTSANSGISRLFLFNPFYLKCKETFSFYLKSLLY